MEDEDEARLAMGKGRSRWAWRPLILERFIVGIDSLLVTPSRPTSEMIYDSITTRPSRPTMRPNGIEKA